MKILTVHPLTYVNERLSHPDLFLAFEEHMIARGHERATSPAAADLAVFDMNACPESDPYDWNVLNVILERNTPVCFMDDWDHVSGGIWPGQYDWVRARLTAERDKCDWARFCAAASREPRRKLYFKRKMEWHPVEPYPEWVFPLEYPMFADYPLVSKEELFARPHDLCILANEGNTREHAIASLMQDGRLNVFGGIILSHSRYPYDEWVNFHRQAKMFVEADASLGSERPMHLMTVAPMLRIKSDHRLAFPREDMVHQVVVGDYCGHVSREDCDKILSVVQDPDKLYSIYVAGAEHMRKHYSMAARCAYMADIVEKFMQ